MQWAARLVATPQGKTNLQRTLARERRRVIANSYMFPLIGLLFWTLLLSIGLFVAGFLIQLWALASSFVEPAPILIAGAVFATALALVIVGLIVSTTVHASLHINSPFESPLSTALKPVLRCIHEYSRSRGANQRRIEGEEDVESVGFLIKWDDNDDETLKALKTYARLVIDTSDAELLQQVAPSFNFRSWYLAGDALFPVFLAVRERFLATDTSSSVKETILEQLRSFADRDGWMKIQSPDKPMWKDDLGANELTQWCKSHCQMLVETSRESRRLIFPLWVFFASLEDGNADLRGRGPDSYDKCIARVICSYFGARELGPRGVIFRAAVKECELAIRGGRSNDIRAILSHYPPVVFLRSLIQNPSVSWHQMSDLLSLITNGVEADILKEMSGFLSNLPEMHTIRSGRSLKLLPFDLLRHLIVGLPVDFKVPPSLDLSPLLALVIRHSCVEEYFFALIYYLDHGGIDNLTDLRPARKLWEYCRSASDGTRSPKDRSRLLAFHSQYHACFRYRRFPRKSAEIYMRTYLR
ncbi:hypothetical protein SISNIDRAFT_161511 [Sistotremastrum niveocremeum HHB9708]|uniref:DUF6535 domain-containing protein n=1 Tax=Sistotremastrum niveocremeum HHB9708 TaxID=1314777 RepID=A0A164SLB5_9AGAM|nr:hypothetical protein SISNIDRAFT_161511 [Sistotremastrum niveocremeum HHB9708]